MQDEAYDPLSKHLASLAKSLGYEVVGPWLYKNAESLPVWQKHAEKIDPNIWKRDLPPVSMFIMKANLNRRCYEYLFPEARDVWHLQPFANATHKILKHVRIYWGQGVIDGAVRSRFGQLVADMFNDPRVVYKLQDIEQGNRSNIMAPWWYEDPEDTEKLDYCDFLVGLYSPVYKAFTHGDLRRLLGALNHDALRMLYDALINQNLDATTEKLHLALDTRWPEDWRTLAVLVNNIDFLEILVCRVQRHDADGPRRDTFELCPHFFRYYVTLRLPGRRTQQPSDTLEPTGRWHPLDWVAQCKTTTINFGDGVLVVRHNGSFQQPNRLVDSAKDFLRLTPRQAQEQEEKIQYKCQGVRCRLADYEPAYEPIVNLALQEEVQSVTVVRKSATASERRCPRYASKLSRTGHAPAFDATEKERPEVVFHVEAYCDSDGVQKPWLRELFKKDLPRRVMQRLQPLEHREGQWQIRLLLLSKRNLKNDHAKKVIAMLVEHCEAVIKHTLHEDPHINQALLFYRARVWAHDDLKRNSRLCQEAAEWLNLANLHEQSLKALLMNANPSKVDLGNISVLSIGQQGCTPRRLACEVFVAACRKLGISINTEISPQDRITLPVVPGLAFIVSLRNVMYQLERENAEFSFGEPDDTGIGLYKLLISKVHDRAINTIRGQGRRGGLCQAVEHLRRCGVHNLQVAEDDDRLSYFKGLGPNSAVVAVEPTDGGALIVKWRGLGPG